MEIKSITVLGAGTTGLTTALILKKKLPELDVTVIGSSQIGIIGVGEGSTEHLNKFRELLGISRWDMVRDTGGSLKYGIYFDGWCGEGTHYIHSLSDLVLANDDQYEYMMGGILIDNDDSDATVDPHLIENIVQENSPPNQFHFNTFKLNDFLVKQCELNKIKIIDDKIKSVDKDDKQNIVSLHGEETVYRADFYVDCSGFRRELLGKYEDVEFISKSDQLLLNHAIAFPTDELPDYPALTISKAMKAGWMWRIPVYGRTGNGYVFSDKHISVEEAKKEVEDLLGHSIEIARDVKFEPGYLNKFWKNNVCAVGISGSFFEPIEATAIGTGLQQAFLLADLLPAYRKNQEYQAKRFNDVMQYFMNNLFEFVRLHYVNAREDTPFWKDVSNLPLPEELKQKIHSWKTRLPRKWEFEYRPHVLFQQNNFIQLLNAIEWFDKSAIKEEMELKGYYDRYKIEQAEKIKQRKEDTKAIKMKHRDFIYKLHEEE
jgi:tryptophan halogenase